MEGSGDAEAAAEAEDPLAVAGKDSGKDAGRVR